MKASDLRSQLKATKIKTLKSQVDADNELVGVKGNNEYLKLEDGKQLKIRIFPAHPGGEQFYMARKCYWLPREKQDGSIGRSNVNDSRVHGGTKLDLVEEYTKMVKSKFPKDADKIKAVVGGGFGEKIEDSLKPQYSWLCYAGIVQKNEDDEKFCRAKLFEMKKQYRDALNKLTFSEDDDDAIEVDPFTDPDEGLIVLSKYNKKPDKKAKEDYYEATFGRRPETYALTDEDIEHFMSLTPLTEIYPKYGIKEFEQALSGLQLFDEDKEIELFEDEDWLAMVETVRAQYNDEEQEEKPAKKAKKVVKPEPKDEDEEEDEDEPSEESESGDPLDGMDRKELKAYIKDNNLLIGVFKTDTEDDLRDKIREAIETKKKMLSGNSEPEQEEDDEEEAPKSSRATIEDIRNKLASRK